jgi:hypothetical protein
MEERFRRLAVEELAIKDDKVSLSIKALVDDPRSKLD